MSDVRCSHRACPNVLSVPIVATSPVAELLSRFNYIFCRVNNNNNKKKLSLLTRTIFDASLLNVFIGLDMSHHALAMHLADDVIFPEFVLNVLLLCSHSCPPISLLLWGRHVRNGSVGLVSASSDCNLPNRRTCNGEYHVNPRVED